MLIVHSTSDAFSLDVQNNLTGTGAFAVVDRFDAHVATPTVQQLKMYDVVLAFSDGSLADPKAVGDNLATYYDGGGRVVTAVLANVYNLQASMTGVFRTIASGYLLINSQSASNTAGSMGMVLERRAH